MPKEQVNSDLSNNPERNEIKMPLMKHEFKDFFFHPKKPNVLICLERNKYQETTEAYHLSSIESGKKQEAFGAMITKTLGKPTSSPNKTPNAKDAPTLIKNDLQGGVPGQAILE